MPTGPRKIILINSGRYEYAEVEINGALQIVGPNNTGKTTLINTLQFLYLNDRRNMDFGSYTPEQTRDFYFPGQYSYMLFECMGVDGVCVMGWRGQSKAAGGEPERFCHRGPYDPADFMNERQQVREPRDVNAALALKQFRIIKSAQEHAEFLMTPVGDSKGLGIVALREADKYHHFRETLKNLLTLSTITQEQMRDRLLMMADIPPDRVALDIRALFGDDYDKVCQQRDRLSRFKANQPLIERLVERTTELDVVRGELIYRWSDLRTKKQGFEQEQTALLSKYEDEIKAQEEKLVLTRQELDNRRADIVKFAKELGGIQGKLGELEKMDREYAEFLVDFEQAALTKLKEEIRALENQIGASERETREKAVQKLAQFTDLVAQKERTIAQFDKLALTALRKNFSEEELSILFSLLNPALLEMPVSADGIEILRKKQLTAALREVISRVNDGVYKDENVRVKLPTQKLATNLPNLEIAKEELEDFRANLAYWESVLAAIEQRDTLDKELAAKIAQSREIERRLYAFEAYQTEKLIEPRLKEEIKTVSKSVEVAEERAKVLENHRKTAENAQSAARSAIQKAKSEFDEVMGRYSACVFPEFDVKPHPVHDIPNDFDAATALYLRQQEKQTKLLDESNRLLVDIERCFGDEFRGGDNQETIRLLTEELEARADKEDALTREWNAQIHGLKATFDRVLKELNEVHSAKDALNRHFGKVQVSNLKMLKMEVIENSDFVSWIKRLAAIEPGGLFERDAQQESAVNNFRTKLQSNPILRFADLFTLGVTVEGPDSRKHTYHDFRQIESHGTTIAIKVLFNLLLLKSQLKRDDCHVPFFLDEIQILDPSNRAAILLTARNLGFLPITAAPEAVSEVDALYFLQPRRGAGWIVLRNQHRLGLKGKTPVT